MLNYTREQRIMMIENRIQKLTGTEKNLKCPGVLRRCRRELRNLKKEK